MEKLKTMLMPLRVSDIVPLARVPWNDPVEIRRVLDLGWLGSSCRGLMLGKRQSVWLRLCAIRRGA